MARRNVFFGRHFHHFCTGNHLKTKPVRSVHLKDYFEISKNFPQVFSEKIPPFPSIPQRGKIQWPFPETHETNFFWKTWTRVCVNSVLRPSIWFLRFFCKIHIENLETFLHYIHSRNCGIPLLSISNHTSCLDDPLIWGAFLKRFDYRNLSNDKNTAHEHASSQTVVDRIRFALAAEEIVFRFGILNYFFSGGRVIPIRRGDGIYQAG
eukprot:Sdes_comp15094_c0_seq1m3891